MPTALSALAKLFAAYRRPNKRPILAFLFTAKPEPFVHWDMRLASSEISVGEPVPILKQLIRKLVWPLALKKFVPLARTPSNRVLLSSKVTVTVAPASFMKKPTSPVLLVPVTPDAYGWA